jgi:hypothetical protein
LRLLMIAVDFRKKKRKKEEMMKTVRRGVVG